MYIDKDKYTKQLEAIRNEMKSTKYQRYNEIGGTYKTLEKMAELCLTIINAYDTDWDLMYDKQLHKAVRATDVLFELLEDAGKLDSAKSNSESRRKNALVCRIHTCVPVGLSS